MADTFDVRRQPPGRAGHRRRAPDPYAVTFAAECRANPGSWIRFAPRDENFQAQHLASTARDQIYRGAEPWGNDRWEATTRKVRRKRQDPETGAYGWEWELWVSYQGPREVVEPEPDPGVDEEGDPAQPAFPFFDRY